MKNFESYHVYPRVPEKLNFVETLVQNLWWSWRLEAIEFIRRIDPQKWRDSGHNPLVMFCDLFSQDELERIAHDERILKQLKEIREQFEIEVLAKHCPEEIGLPQDTTVAYFSMEYGIHECIPMFSGGLGVLAGDYLKAASDFCVPLVAVGLFYRNGYFKQFLTHDGWQLEEYPEIDVYYIPVKKAKDSNYNTVYVKVHSPMGDIYAKAWKIDVGRITLYLLDTNLEQNPPELRKITSRLYPAESHVRLAQEALLGIGGMKLLEQIGHFPTICHLNEGHCSFTCLERLAQLMKRFNLDLKEAVELLPRTNMITTHTPVAAGYDLYPLDMVRPYLEPYAELFNVSVEEIISWGQRGGIYNPNEKFCMFTFGLKLSQFCNGVSKLHENTAKKMWNHIWPDRPLEEVPITHVTNGVHITSWISIENHSLFERYIASKWYSESKQTIMDGIDSIYEEDLWRARELSRARLIRFCRYMMKKQYLRRNAPKSVIDVIENVLDPDILTIGFARRFTAYKRANLILKDPERLKRIISSKHPVQFIFAGKAHPKDEEGKRIIQQIINFAKSEDVREKFIFLEDYDINIARHLVQGVDVWLNTPRRPFEACGTSGMKAAINGVLNFSVLDGWWCEGYREDRGWEIGEGKEYSDPNYQDEVEAYAMYNRLEEEIIPLFYENRKGDLPFEWIRMMKESMKMGIVYFSANRMLREYVDRFYCKAAKNFFELTERGCEKAKQYAVQRKRLLDLWKFVKINKPVKVGPSYFRVGDEFDVFVEVFLGELRPDEVEVELYFGKLKGLDHIQKSDIKKMEVHQDKGNGSYIYKCVVTCIESGRFGFNVRILPSGDEYLKYNSNFIKWAE